MGEGTADRRHLPQEAGRSEGAAGAGFPEANGAPVVTARGRESLGVLFRGDASQRLVKQHGEAPLILRHGCFPLWLATTAGRAEVGHDSAGPSLTVGHKNVVGAEIAVGKPGRVHLGDDFRHVAKQVERTRKGQPPLPGKQRPERASFHPSQRQKRWDATFVEQLGNAGVAKLPPDRRLALQAEGGLRHLVLSHLDRTRRRFHRAGGTIRKALGPEDAGIRAFGVPGAEAIAAPASSAQYLSRSDRHHAHGASSRLTVPRGGTETSCSTACPARQTSRSR